MSFAVRAAVAASRSLVENLETRRLLAGQAFAGAGPIASKVGRAVIAADFNGDGKSDLATIASTQSTFSTLTLSLGQGGGVFEPAPYIAPSLPGNALVAADFDHDGYADLVVGRAGGANTVDVLRGRPDGKLVVTSSYAVPFSSLNLVTADVNNDGKLDIVSANNTSNSVSVLLGNGDATFAAPVLSQFNIRASSLAAGDFNADGRIDLAVVSDLGGGATLSIFDGNGLGQFGTPTTSTSGPYPDARDPSAQYAAGIRSKDVVVADFNADNRPDLAVANYGPSVSNSVGSVALLLANPAGGFAAPVQFPVGSGAIALSVGDVNADDKPDLAVANSLANTVSFLLGTGSGLVSGATATVGLNPWDATLADVNADGKLDLLTANNGEYSDTVLLGDNSGTFGAPPPVAAVGATPRGAAVADFNNDGKLDVATANSASNTASVLLGNGDGTLGTAATLTVGNQPYAIVTADFNLDGNADLATANYAANSVSILFGQGNGTFAAPTTVGLGTNAQPINLTVGDFNNDGRPDLAVATSGVRSVAIVRNLPGGTFIVSNVAVGGSTSGVPGPQTIVTANFNNDAWLDLAVAVDGQLTILNGVGGYTFTSPGSIRITGGAGGTGYVQHAVAAGDFDGDGDADLIYSYVSDSLGTLYRNDGAGVFVFADLIRLSGSPLQFTTADFDGDGRTDLAAPSVGSAAYGSLFVTHLAGGGNLVADAVSVPAASLFVAVGDFNNDGKPDLASLGGSANNVTILLNRRPDAANVTASNGVIRITPSAGQPTTVTRAGDSLTIGTLSGVETRALTGITRVVVAGNAVMIGSDLGGGGRPLQLQVDAGATALLTTSQHLASLTADGVVSLAAGGGRVLRTNALAVGPAGVIDLNDNAMIYDYAAASPQQETVRGLLASGRADGTWAGVGLTSSAARQNAGRTTLGYLEATAFKSLNGPAATFAGEAIDDTAVLVRYTLYGDTDLDAGVSINDFNRLAAAFGTAAGRTWLDGDFDYDGGVSINDFNLLSSNFGATLPVAAPAAAPVIRKGVTPAKR